MWHGICYKILLLFIRACSPTHVHSLAHPPINVVNLVCVLVSTVSIIYNDGNITLVSCNKNEYPKIQCSWAYYRSTVTCIVVVYISHGIHNMFFQECQLLICNCWHCNNLHYVFVVSHVTCYKFWPNWWERNLL
jgi:hypothetical protein